MINQWSTSVTFSTQCWLWKMSMLFCNNACETKISHSTCRRVFIAHSTRTPSFIIRSLELFAAEAHHRVRWQACRAALLLKVNSFVNVDFTGVARREKLNDVRLRWRLLSEPAKQSALRPTSDTLLDGDSVSPSGAHSQWEETKFSPKWEQTRPSSSSSSSSLGDL